MLYQWKFPEPMPVPAQTAGEEIERMAKNGTVTAERVVDESRPTTAPLRKCFEWDNETAAEKYRVYQARNLINAIVVVPDETVKEPVRAFVHVVSEYKPIKTVLVDQSDTDYMLKTALRELNSFRKKYSALKELCSVFDAIDRLSN